MDNDRKRILILEDNPSDAELEVSHINELDLNLELVVCTNRKDYEQTLETFTPDVVLSDYNLPSYTGEDALLYLRQKDPDELIPFVLVTGVIRVTDATKMMKIGVFDLVEKDNLETLEPVLQRALSVAEDRKEAHQQKALLAKVSSISRVGGWELDLRTNELTWTSVTKGIHGVPADYEPNVESGINFFKAGWSKNRIEECVNEAVEQGKSYDEKLILVTAAGEEIWVRTMGEALMEDGKCVRLLGTIQDVDRYVKLEQEQEIIAERHRSVLEATRAVTWDWHIPENKIYVDRAFQDLAIPESAEEVQVKTDNSGAFLTVEMLEKLIFPDDRELFQQQMAAHLSGETAVFDIEYRAYDNVGELIWVNNRGSIVERGDNGEPVRVVGSIVDNTTMHDLHKELKDKESLISGIADNVKGAIYRYALYPNGKDKVLYLNKGAEEFFGISMDEAKSRARLLFERIHPDDIQGVMSEIQEAGQNVMPLINTFRLNFESRGYIWIKNTALPTKQPDGTVIWDGFTIDINTEIENRENFETVFQLSPIAKFIFNPKTGKILNANKKASELYGYSHDELLGMNATDIRRNRKADRNFASIIRDIVSGVKLYSFHAIHLKKDGSEMVVEADANVINYGGAQCIIAAIRDVTQELAQKEELRKLSLVANKSTNGVIITNAEQDIEWVNEGFERLTGYTFKEAQGKNARFLQGEGTREEDRAVLREGIQNKEPCFTEILNYTKDGKPYWVEVFLTPVKDEEGNVTNFVAIENDISNRKRREEEILLSRKQTEAALHELELRNLAVDQHSIVAITDTEGTIEYANDKFCQVSGYSREELVGANHRILNSGHHGVKFWREMYATIANRKVWNGVVRNKTKDDKYYWLRTTITPFTDPETGKVERYIAIRTDITARIEAEQKLRNTLDNLEELVQQKTEKLELAQRNVVESLTYAQRLQQALIPSVDRFKKYVADAATILRPRDIVSGDFYWVHGTKEEVLISLVDCTGHGVPGAMMSMLANELMNNVMIQKGLSRPDVVLEELDDLVRGQLMSDNSEMRMHDGMDMSVVAIDHRSGLFSYSGAKSYGVYYHAKTKEFEELKPDRFSIGGDLENERLKDFTRQRLEFFSGDRIFLFSDGICDQFGGPEGKKFMRRRLKNLIEELEEFTIPEQVEKIEASLLDWMGDEPQLDDISFLAVEL